MKRFVHGLLLAAFLGLGGIASAQDAWPSRPVRILVGFPAGTSSDIMARLYAQRLSDHYKRPFIVENRTGLGGNLAAQAAAKAPADGYTFLLATVANTISASVYKDLGYDFLEDFRPVVRMSSAPNVLVVGPSLSVTSVRELIDVAKAQPGKLFFGSAGIGTAPHLSGELFNLLAGTKMVHVPYKGNAQGLLDLADGRLSMVFAPAPTLAAFLMDGRVKALATTAATRSSFLPDLPTLSESGLPGFDTSIWYGFVALKGTPAAAIAGVADVTMKATDTPEMRALLATNGADPMPAGTEEFGRFLVEDVRKWAKVVEFANVKPE